MEGTGEGVWILMFSEVTLFEYNVSTILSPIVAKVTKYIVLQNDITRQIYY